MKLVDMQTDREKSSVMKDLHEVGLRHGLTFVVVARPIDAKEFDPTVLTGFLIDHKDDTPPEDLYRRWLQAGIYLIQGTSAVENYVAEQRAKQPAPVKSP